jgi:hypothetical protein
MSAEWAHVLLDLVALGFSVIACIFSWISRKVASNDDLQKRVIKLEAQAESRIDSDDIKALSDEIHELRGELKHTVRTVERMNQFLMDRGGA